MSTCPWKIRFGMNEDATVQCAKESHVPLDPLHEALFNGITITWYELDRGEYTGDWPGYCARLPGVTFSGGCTLPAGHHGNCAP